MIALANPRRIKASHRRRGKVASAHRLYIMNNPLAGTDPTGYVACSDVKNDTPGSGSCDQTLSSGKTVSVDYKIGKNGTVSVSSTASNISAIAADNAARASNGTSGGSGAKGQPSIGNFIQSGGKIQKNDGFWGGTGKGLVDSGSEIVTGTIGLLGRIGTFFEPEYEALTPIPEPTSVFGEAHGQVGEGGYKFGHAAGVAFSALLPSKVVGLRGPQVAKGLPEGAQFAQKTFNPMFSKGGAFAGKSVDDVAGALRSGTMKPSQVPIDYIVRDGRALILNTRSAQALEAAGIPRSQWNAVNRSGQPFYEGQLNGQLTRNPGGPFDSVRRSGGN